MPPDIDPDSVARRLSQLAAIYVPETVEQGRRRLQLESSAPDALARAVAVRLEELRALDELTRYLHSAPRPQRR